jgi:hypothetical protein
MLLCFPHYRRKSWSPRSVSSLPRSCGLSSKWALGTGQLFPVTSFNHVCPSQDGFVLGTSRGNQEELVLGDWMVLARGVLHYLCTHLLPPSLPEIYLLFILVFWLFPNVWCSSYMTHAIWVRHSSSDRPSTPPAGKKVASNYIESPM